MNPINWLQNWLSEQSTNTLWIIVCSCLAGLFMLTLYILESGVEKGFRIRRSRRWW